MLTADQLVVGGRYNWKGQPERLIYQGVMRDPTGIWHQFCKVDDPHKTVWCEVRASDIERFERTRDSLGPIHIGNVPHSQPHPFHKRRAGRLKIGR